ncbi:chitinase-3-like protein 1 [Pararge aegeria]|uniref:Jg1890 protein n=2 Tax=Pararge aegeria TaxID=116150 RepID=A0A8S4QZA3_9NEOP|nr:chitinase-3-like protein 1 [Pararge aegeria]CAH2227959.1 jg1890 [Pararge aegeria aegeria]
MVFKKIQINKSDYANPINIENCAERKGHRRRCNMVLLGILLLVSCAFAALLAGALLLRRREAALQVRYRHLVAAKSLYYRSHPLPGGLSQVVSCYYDMPTPRRPGARQLLPADIHPNLCTHINVAFAQIKDKKIFLEGYQHQVISDVVKLKEINPNLKVLLSVGGAGNHGGFSEMVFNHTCRKTFIRSIKYTLKNLTLDGIDLDWEFPVVKYQNDFGNRERQHFSQLLREIRMEYNRERRDYLLTVAVAAPQIIVDAAYDVDQINLYVDFVNLMTYDFHTYTKFTPMTGLNSPLYPRASEQLYLATLNTNYTVEMYKTKGLDPFKIVVGIPTYGHTFTLVNRDNTKVGSPAVGFGTLGEQGFVNYPDICKFLNKFQNESTIKMDEDAKVPYFFKNSEWVSYDNPESVIEKAKYIRRNNLRGAMIYSLNADDYDGKCSGVEGTEKFPLAFSIKNTLRGM